MQLTNRLKSAATLGALLLTAHHPAHAVVLQQKWVPNQQLVYDLSLNGTLNLLMEDDASSLFAGMPLEVDMRLQNETVFDTLAVDEAGTGTVAVRLDRLNLKASTFGAQLLIKDGRINVLFGGKSVGANKEMDLDDIKNPPLAWRISRQGRLEGIVPIKGRRIKVLGEQDPAAGKSERKRGPLPFKLSDFVQFFISRSLPTLWPEHEVKTGDKWAAEFRWPPANQLGVAVEAVPTTGNFELTLRGEEEIYGRKAQRIAIDGTITADQGKAVTGKAGDKPGSATSLSARQHVKGDLWLDPEAGQMVRLELDLESQARQKRTGAPARSGRAGSWGDFAGTLQVQLRSVSAVTPEANATTKADAQPTPPGS